MLGQYTRAESKTMIPVERAKGFLPKHIIEKKTATPSIPKEAVEKSL